MSNSNSTASSGGQTGNSAPSGSQETDPSAARLTCTAEDANCLQIAGKIEGEATGSRRVDVQECVSAPILVHTLELQSGEFSFYAPKGYGKMIVTGFIDEKGDGPSPKDPQGRVEIEVAEVALTDLTLELRSDNAPSIPTPPDQQPNTPGSEQQPAGNAGAAPAPAQGAQKADAPAEAPKEEAAPAGPPAESHYSRILSRTMPAIAAKIL